MLPPMRKLTWFIMLGVIAVPVLTIWLTLTWPREPSYNGKSLTYWLEHYFPPPTSMIGSYVASDPQAVEAIRKIGTNGIPTLLRHIRAHDPPLKLKLVAFAEKQHLVTVEVPGGGVGYAIPLQPATPQKQKHRLRIQFTPAVVRHQWAELGFMLLGSAGSNAVPSLVEVLDAETWGTAQWSAVQALGAIGPAATPAAPAILRALAGTNNMDQGRCLWALGQIHGHPESVVPVLIKHLNQRNFEQVAAEALGQFGPEAAPAVPDLIRILDRNDATSTRAASALGHIGPAAKQAIPSLLRSAPKTNRGSEFRFQCILALGGIHQEPELVVPALTSCISETLREQDVRIRLFCAEALGQYGTNATPAVALLTKLLADQNPNVRRAATNALQQISPPTAAP